MPSVNTKLKLAFQTVPFKSLILMGLEFKLLTNKRNLAGAKKINEIKNKIKKKFHKFSTVNSFCRSFFFDNI